MVEKRNSTRFLLLTITLRVKKSRQGKGCREVIQGRLGRKQVWVITD